ncbi:hypothetical protein VPH35_105217 [Triticum aestivum]
MPCYCPGHFLTNASARHPRRHHATPPPPRRADGPRAGRDGRVHLRRVLAVQVRARHRLREQPRLPPRLHRLHRLLRRRLQQLHRRRRRRPGGGDPHGRVRPVSVPRRPRPRRVRGVRAGGGGAPGRRVAAGGRLLRAVRRQRLRRPGRQHRRVPQVQLRQQRGRRVPQEPRRRAQGAAGAGRDGVQADRLRHGAGRGAVPRRHRGAGLRRVPGAGGGAAQGHVRLRAGRRRLPGAVLRQVLAKRTRLPLFTGLFGRRIWEDRGYNNWHLGRASTPGGVHLFPQQSMLEAHTAQVTSSYSIRD